MAMKKNRKMKGSKMMGLKNRSRQQGEKEDEMEGAGHESGESMSMEKAEDKAEQIKRQDPETMRCGFRAMEKNLCAQMMKKKK